MRGASGVRRGWPQEAESTQAWRATFAQALQSYQRGDLAAAQAEFTALLQLKPDDGPAKFYLERVAEFGQADVPATWTGEVWLKEK